MNVLLCVDQDAILDDLLVAFRWGVRMGPTDVVRVVHVIPKLTWLRAVGRVDATIGQELASLPEQAEKTLSKAVDFFSKEGLKAETECREGNPAEEIVEAAREIEAELVVVGALGREDRENYLLGSVSQKVKRYADRDVFIVRRGGPTEPTRFNAVLAVDGSEESLAAVRSFANKMHVVLADILLLHVVEEGMPTGGEALDKAKAILERESLECTTEIRAGRAATEILACARQHDARVIALGARGLGAVSGAFMGSVSARVSRHAPCAVLCARSPH